MSEAWVQAGGDARRLALYGRIGKVATFTGGGRCLASIHPALPSIGAVGDWVGGDDVRVRAEAWLAEHGCTVARGPMELCTWFAYRASLGPFDEAPFALEPIEPADRWTAAGYAPIAAYSSAVADHDVQIADSAERAGALTAAGWRIEGLPNQGGKVPPDAWRDAVAAVHRLSTAAFSEAFGFAPIPEEALHALYAAYRDAVDPDLCRMAIGPDGALGGFLFSIPDLLRPDRGWFLVKTLAVLPEHRRLGLGSWLVADSHRVARDKGFRAGVHCLMWTGSKSNAISAHGGRVFRRYALLEKRL